MVRWVLDDNKGASPTGSEFVWGLDRICNENIVSLYRSYAPRLYDDLIHSQPFVDPISLMCVRSSNYRSVSVVQSLYIFLHTSHSLISLELLHQTSVRRESIYIKH